MRILVVEDDDVIRRELKILLENALYEVELITEFDQAGEQIRKLHVDLILLDLSLPGVSGFDICTQVRSFSEVPIIFLTSNTDAMSELTGMLKGGDDYITKPFHAPILLARIAAVLKRSQKNSEAQTKLEHRGVRLDVMKSSITYKDKEAELTKNELKILHCLFLKPEEIVSRMDLVDYLWDNQVFIDDNTLSVHMTRIRGKLEELGIREFIETKRGMGYRII